MLGLSILCWLMLNSVTPVPTWCWAFWWIMVILQIIQAIAEFIKLGMKLGN